MEANSMVCGPILGVFFPRVEHTERRFFLAELFHGLDCWIPVVGPEVWRQRAFFLNFGCVPWWLARTSTVDDSWVWSKNSVQQGPVANKNDVNLMIGECWQLIHFPITFSDVFHIHVSSMNFFVSVWQDQNVQVCCCTSEGQLQWHGHGYFFWGADMYVLFLGVHV